ncbi:MAG TPA: TIGR04283 family arsenosugar biosynthesis glycosyltransferase [Beijerinckiaceae bacterium]|nr:TIGR04283 family arsenosugar biosynthesis glycosyltransferase [Beijerinckiaceae bacterium]
MKLSIVVPTLNEAEGIAAHLEALAPLRQRGAEVIVADGGSRDGTVERAAGLADKVLTARRGRAAQMNAGAAAASGAAILFLHADTRLPAAADRLVADALAAGSEWGRFDVRIDGRHPLLGVVARAMNLRSRATGIATGDQAIFVTRKAFLAIGGYADIPLMEDIVLSCALRRRSRPACLSATVTTSGRRWEAGGVLYTIVTMWRLRLAFYLGADPRRLARAYGYGAGDA